MQRLSERAQREANPKQKIIWLWRLTQPLKAATAGIAACKEGCSHCCYTPVPMHYTEAQVIAEHAKQEMTVPDSYVMEPNMKYVGTPCPFLKNDKCSIYSSRPFACRVHYNMDRDESRCVLGNKPKTVPYFNRRPYDMAYVSAIGLDDLRYADIRDFFPS
jgi:Fe-S-cluster containining protein